MYYLTVFLSFLRHQSSVSTCAHKNITLNTVCNNSQDLKLIWNSSPNVMNSGSLLLQMAHLNFEKNISVLLAVFNQSNLFASITQCTILKLWVQRAISSVCSNVESQSNEFLKGCYEWCLYHHLTIFFAALMKLIQENLLLWTPWITHQLPLFVMEWSSSFLRLSGEWLLSEPSFFWQHCCG